VSIKQKGNIKKSRFRCFVSASYIVTLFTFPISIMFHHASINYINR